MAYAVQFFVNSTGYVEGSMPPRFDKKHVKPIPMCGSDGYYKPDGRWGRDHVEDAAINRARAMNKNLNSGIVGYKIMRCRIHGDDIPAGIFKSI